MSDKMWTLFEQYQPHADKAGHGESWKRMTTERTLKSMQTALNAAWDAEGATTDAAAYAADAAWDATRAADGSAASARAKNAAYAAHAAWAEAAAKYEARAIERIKRAIEEAKA